jgi:hypothetical protein
MTGDLFRAPLPAQLPPPNPDANTLVGPYGRQELAGYRIKFWFALVDGTGGRLHQRYELLFTKGEAIPRWRARGDSEDTTFREHAIPDDLSSFPALTFPRHKGDRLMAAMQSMLVGEDLADAVRLARFGVMPAR